MPLLHLYNKAKLPFLEGGGREGINKSLVVFAPSRDLDPGDNNFINTVKISLCPSACEPAIYSAAIVPLYPVVFIRSQRQPKISLGHVVLSLIGRNFLPLPSPALSRWRGNEAFHN